MCLLARSPIDLQGSMKCHPFWAGQTTYTQQAESDPLIWSSRHADFPASRKILVIISHHRSSDAKEAAKFTRNTNYIISLFICDHRDAPNGAPASRRHHLLVGNSNDCFRPCQRKLMNQADHMIIRSKQRDTTLWFSNLAMENLSFCLMKVPSQPEQC